MKVLVIGGAGYIGSHAVYELVRDNNEVIVMDNFSTGLREMVHEKAKIYEGDITVKEDLLRVFKAECDIKPFDVVMHFAAKIVVPESVDKPLAYYHNNVEGVRLMLEVMTEFNIKNVVFSSTAAVYGQPKEDICKEDSETNPINPYGETKLASEKMIKWVCSAYNMNYCIFRYFNVAGADESLKIGLKRDTLTHIIPITIQTALGIRSEMYLFGDDYETRDGTCVRDYIHVSDLAYAHVLGAKYIIEHNKSILLNLGSSKGFTVKEVIDTVSKIKPVNYVVTGRRQGDPAVLIASNEKAKEIIGWEPKRTLKDIIETDMKFREKQ